MQAGWAKKYRRTWQYHYSYLVVSQNPGGPLAEAPTDALVPREYTGADEQLREQLEAH
jgi:hypothetical protein